MRRPEFIARQAARPTGLVGRLLVRVMASETASFNREVLAVLAPSPGERVLEVGYGHGRTLAEAARRAPLALFSGLDASIDACRVAGGRCRGPIAEGRVELRVGESASLPWPNATFDKAFAVHTLYFWVDPQRELRELARVLKPGAVLVLGFREPSASARSSFPSSVYHFRPAEEIEAALASAGFIGGESRSFGDGDLRVLVARMGSPGALS